MNGEKSMSSKDEIHETLEEITLRNGEVVYKLSEKQAKVLEQMIADRIWWEETQRRFKRVGLIAAFFFAFLASASAWWPWITRMAQFFLQDVPKP